MNMKQKELNEILKEHQLWLDSNGKKGNKADLIYVDLCELDLSFANLKRANLYDAALVDVNLRSANLRYANLMFANLGYANLTGADLSGANLSSADLYSADLSGADLRDATLSNANLNGANLDNTLLDKDEQIRKGIILQEKMIGWKKCCNDILVKLEVPKGATVFSINNHKCRTNIAKIVKIVGGDGKSAISKYDEKFIYILGETVEVKDFNQYYNIECGAGIHFFRTKKEAINYNY